MSNSSFLAISQLGVPPQWCIAHIYGVIAKNNFLLFLVYIFMINKHTELFSYELLSSSLEIIKQEKRRRDSTRWNGWAGEEAGGSTGDSPVLKPMCRGCWSALGSQHPLGATSTSTLLGSVRCPPCGRDGAGSEETRAMLYTRGSHMPLVMCCAALFAALAFSFPTSKVEKSAAFILNDTFKRKRKHQCLLLSVAISY